jgi:DNA-binding response OmpR family regulator
MDKPKIELRAKGPDKIKSRINLERASILLMDNAWGVEILSRIFSGFGSKQLHRCTSVAAASEIVRQHSIDLIVSEAMLDDDDVYGFIRSLRLNSDNEVNRFVPVILLSAHTAARKVIEARDCGANLFVAKPISPKVMMERVRWVADSRRKYLETGNYAGPDRRFHDNGPPEGVIGRRRTDAVADPAAEETAA